MFDKTDFAVASESHHWMYCLQRLRFDRPQKLRQNAQTQSNCRNWTSMRRIMEKNNCYDDEEP